MGNTVFDVRTDGMQTLSYLPPDQIDIRPLSVGKGMPNEEVYIVDEHGRRVGQASSASSSFADRTS
jgi:hypothetical protein